MATVRKITRDQLGRLVSTKGPIGENDPELVKALESLANAVGSGSLGGDLTGGDIITIINNAADQITNVYQSVNDVAARTQALAEELDSGPRADVESLELEIVDVADNQTTHDVESIVLEIVDAADDQTTHALAAIDVATRANETAERSEALSWLSIQ